MADARHLITKFKILKSKTQIIAILFLNYATVERGKN
jgi:hypothetical protein